MKQYEFIQNSHKNLILNQNSNRSMPNYQNSFDMTNFKVILHSPKSSISYNFQKGKPVSQNTDILNSILQPNKIRVPSHTQYNKYEGQHMYNLSSIEGKPRQTSQNSKPNATSNVKQLPKEELNYFRIDGNSDKNKRSFTNDQKTDHEKHKLTNFGISKRAQLVPPPPINAPLYIQTNQNNLLFTVNNNIISRYPLSSSQERQQRKERNSNYFESKILSFKPYNELNQLNIDTQTPNNKISFQQLTPLSVPNYTQATQTYNQYKQQQISQTIPTNIPNHPSQIQPLSSKIQSPLNKDLSRTNSPSANKFFPLKYPTITSTSNTNIDSGLNEPSTNLKKDDLIDSQNMMEMSMIELKITKKSLLDTDSGFKDKWVQVQQQNDDLLQRIMQQESFIQDQRTMSQLTEKKLQHIEQEVIQLENFQSKNLKESGSNKPQVDSLKSTSESRAQKVNKPIINDKKDSNQKLEEEITNKSSLIQQLDVSVKKLNNVILNQEISVQKQPPSQKQSFVDLRMHCYLEKMENESLKIQVDSMINQLKLKDESIKSLEEQLIIKENQLQKQNQINTDQSIRTEQKSLRTTQTQQQDMQIIRQENMDFREQIILLKAKNNRLFIENKTKIEQNQTLQKEITSLKNINPMTKQETTTFLNQIEREGQKILNKKN